MRGFFVFINEELSIPERKTLAKQTKKLIELKTKNQQIMVINIWGLENVLDLDENAKYISSGKNFAIYEQSNFDKTYYNVNKK